MKILHVVSSLDRAGVPNVLLQYARKINSHEFVLDYAVHGSQIGAQENLALSQGSNVYHLTPRKVSLFANLRELWHLVRSGNYDVVHSHLNFSSLFPLGIAKASGVPVRIAHAHGSFQPSGLTQRLWFGLARWLLPLLATDLFSCSEESGTWLFGGKWRRTDGKFLMKNAIDVKRIRQNVSVPPEGMPLLPPGTKVLFAAGRLSPEKNHSFLLEIANELNISDQKFHLFIAGDGPLRDELQDEIDRRNINHRVTLLGQRTDVESWLSVATLHLLPSIREGLPMILVEAQALSAYSIVSTGVPREADITGTVKFIPLVAREWVKEIAISGGNAEKEDFTSQLVAEGYEIDTAAANYSAYMKTRLEELDSKGA